MYVQVVFIVNACCGSFVIIRVHNSSQLYSTIILISSLKFSILKIGDDKRVRWFIWIWTQSRAFYCCKLIHRFPSTCTSLNSYKNYVILNDMRFQLIHLNSKESFIQLGFRGRREWQNKLDIRALDLYCSSLIRVASSILKSCCPVNAHKTFPSSITAPFSITTIPAVMI